MCWDRKAFTSKTRCVGVHLPFCVTETQPIPGGDLGTPGRFLATAGMQDFANAD